jgi:hypothetical protein
MSDSKINKGAEDKTSAPTASESGAIPEEGTIKVVTDGIEFDVDNFDISQFV